MAAKFILVEVTKGRLLELRTLSKSEIPAVLKGKKQNQYIYSSQSYKKARKEISDHNEETIDNPVQISTEPKGKKTPKSNAILIWDWTKLNEVNREKIVKLYKSRSYLKIQKMHNNLKLSNITYCCDSYNSWIDHNIKEGVKNGFIQLEKAS